MIKRILALLLLVTTLFSIVSCENDREYDEGEVLAAAAELIEKSLPLNELLYGKGLSYGEEHIGIYYKATDESLAAFGIETVEQMKNMVREVYSTDYSESILTSDAFSPITVDDVIVGYTRYYQSEDEDGNPNGIMVKSDYDYPLKNSYEYHANMSVIDVEGEVIVVRTMVTATSVDGRKMTVNNDVRLIEEESGWRLMTPTYVVFNDYTDIYDKLKK
jgi:hypothetical protein